MSSRLLNMKFMQRAAASTASNPASPATPSSDRPSKRQRLSTGSAAASPATPATPATPVDPDEARRQAAVDRAAAEAGETKWVLSVQEQPSHAYETPMKVVTAGYSAIDSAPSAHLANTHDDMSEDEQVQVRPSLQGRRSFGKFNKAIERQDNPDLSSSEEEATQDSDADSNEVEDSDDEDDPASAMIKQQRKEAADKIRQERKAREKADKAELDRLAKQRRKKEIKLNRLSGGGISSGGISSGGQKSGARRSDVSDMACHQCGQKGHLKVDCPQKQSKSSQRDSSSRPWKRRSGLEYD